ncbi:MAG: L-threonylcarbamoyladenylate synthase [Gammaproteobacteria bacterium]|nr:L-threonylcarbamoyladenylate synthase [Gammaproteobacteria bacterium]NVK89385.1 L-threonylcarbamoyladenylate synthase [Gammaproteobacteria bacterium]
MTPYYVSRWHLNQIIKLLKCGGVVACPTETVWGLGCLPKEQQAVQRILQLKVRAASKGLILLASQPEQIKLWTRGLDDHDLTQIAARKAHPTTYILPASNAAPAWITGGRDTIAIRMTTHPFVQALCDQLGLIVSTSANRSGKAVARNRLQCLQWFGRGLDAIVPGKSASEMDAGPVAPSHIIDWQSGERIR